MTTLVKARRDTTEDPSPRGASSWETPGDGGALWLGRPVANLLAIQGGRRGERNLWPQEPPVGTPQMTTLVTPKSQIRERPLPQDKTSSWEEPLVMTLVIPRRPQRISQHQVRTSGWETCDNLGIAPEEAQG